MPKNITYQDWKNATNAVPFFKHSAQLKAVTDAFSQYNVNPMRLEALRTAFNTWDKATTPPVPAERTTLATAREDLRFTLGHTGGGPTIHATQVQPAGWTLKAWNRTDYPWTAPVTPPQKLSDLTSSQIARVNEAMRRAKHGAEVARDAMLEVKRRNNLNATPLPPEDTAYRELFRNPALIQTVLDRFTVLQLAFSRNPTVVDVRNTLYGTTCYAACFRRDLTAKSAQGVLTLSGAVEVFLGRGFFVGGDYEASTNATVGTLVHEFAHGSFSAVDAPRVLSNGNWELTPSTTPGNLWESPDNSKQSSTPELDRRLANKEPRAAIVNADNYGEYAKTLITQAQK